MPVRECDGVPVGEPVPVRLLLTDIVGERLGVLERLCVGVTDGVAEAEDE